MHKLPVLTALLARLKQLSTCHRLTWPGIRSLVLPERLDRYFFGAWAVTAALLLALLYGLGLVPQGLREIVGALAVPLQTASQTQTAGSALPIASQPLALRIPKIIIPDIAASAPIVLPKQSDFDTLNNALTKGVVHYPGSAMPGEYGNAFFFGHSTGLAVVNNKAYAVFNRLQELKPGNVVRLRYGTREYWYRVTSMKIEKADEAIVDLSPSKTKRLLTLSTCRIFGAKDDRFVVEAEFMKSYPLRTASSAADTSS